MSVRDRIMDFLMDGEATLDELFPVIGCSRSKVHMELQRLEWAGLVQKRKVPAIGGTRGRPRHLFTMSRTRAAA